MFSFLRPGFLRERIVAADSVNGGVQTRCKRGSSLLRSHISVVQVPVKAIGKNRRSVFVLPKLSLKLDLLRAVGGFGRKAEIWCFGSDCECHKNLLFRLIEGDQV